MKILDLHCDTLLSLTSLANNCSQVDLDRLPSSTLYCQCFAIFINDNLRGQKAIDQTEKLYNHFKNNMNSLSSRINQCRTTLEIEKAFDQGKNAAILTIENAAALGGKLENLERMAQYGVKMITLTWNHPNEIGGGNQSKLGLTSFGQELIRMMEKLKIMVDVSHINDKTFWQIAKVTNKPFLASHSNSRTICNHIRNLTDEQVKEISNRDGIVGLNYYIHFLSQKKVTSYDDLLKHIDHLLKLGGENFIALGSDFDGCTTPSFLTSTKDLDKFYNYICKSSLGKDIADKIFYKNAFNYFKKFD